MTPQHFTVIIIGGGPAGVTAAGALAGSGLSVALLEAGVYAGAENWSGCVYFTESLAAEDCFGQDAVAAAPYERRVVRRGTLMHNGLDVVGLELADAATFRNCYTVLRPVYDPYFANLARAKGVVHLTGTTVLSLIREGSRVVGVETNRGPLFADVTFLAEGDAAHLIRSEQLEQVARPHYLQGVKAVLSLPSSEIEQRFGLGPGEGAAYELLIRDPALGGRTAHLNIGAFLYTNRDSLSLGYVAPLEHIRDNFRGRHDLIFEWLSGLPYIKERITGTTLSAYGTKLIRSGGLRDQPIMVEDGFAVGGAGACLGVDIPFPNFTGPASATGLFFARAVRTILKERGSFDSDRLRKHYLAPLHRSAYGSNARRFTAWPAYFAGSRVLFGRTIDVACGTTRFLAAGTLVETGRFLRGHLLSLKGLRELTTDTFRGLGALRLRGPLMRTLVSPRTLWSWTVNLFIRARPPVRKLGLVLQIDGRMLDMRSLPWPVGNLLARLSPRLEQALDSIYANDGRTLENKLAEGLRHAVQGLSITDLLVLPFFCIVLFLAAVMTAAADAFRFFVLKTPVERMLAAPAIAYTELQKRTRDLDAVTPASSLEAKLATNTYRVGMEPHIRTVWPERIADQPSLAQAGLWWVCPARVYAYDTPLLSGRGKVTVSYENCIKCESCWRAEPLHALWGRHTDHGLIYRPESGSLDVLLRTLQEKLPATQAVPGHAPAGAGTANDTRLDSAGRRLLKALQVFKDGMAKLPASADGTRIAWVLALGSRVTSSMQQMAASCIDRLPEQAEMIRSEREALERRLAEGSLMQALYCCIRIEERISRLIPAMPSPDQEPKGSPPAAFTGIPDLFPDRAVKQWEGSVLPEAAAATLRSFVQEHRDQPRETVRQLAAVSPSLGLIASRQLLAMSAVPGISAGTSAVNGELLAAEDTPAGTRITGQAELIPLAASSGLLVLKGGKAYPVPLSAPGLSTTPTPAIGFRAAGLSRLQFDCLVQGEPVAGHPANGESELYLSLALGAADYLSRRVKEHGQGRIQFGGQMLDTEGRDGIAKLGAVKALIARVEAWRLVLQCLDAPAVRSASALPFDLICSALAVKAFGPEPGCLGYDAGQVFGGFAYSEDDLLSRFYRDSSLFRFLAPGLGAAERLDRELPWSELIKALTPELDRIERPPLDRVADRLRNMLQECLTLPSAVESSLAGEAKALVSGAAALLTAAEQTLENGGSAEADAAACEVMIAASEDALHRARLSSGRGRVSSNAVFPLEPPLSAPATTAYEDFCASPGEPHRSGRFLRASFVHAPRYVPEMQFADARLAGRWRELVDWFRTNCREKRFEGLDIERLIDREHRLPEEIIRDVRNNKWLATYIPQELDGLGWRKAEYYILNAAAGSFGDASIDLLIMASTSIGTTPILLGLHEELPRVREELEPLVADERKLSSIEIRLDRLISSFSSPNPGYIRTEYETVMKLVEDGIRHTRVVKYLAANFLKAFYGAGLAGRRGDFTGFTHDLVRARDLFAGLLPDIRAALAEIPRRERCHRFFLRSLGHGGVSAFALTEPTAGSDSGGVKTTARLMHSTLTPLEDGRYSFFPEGRDGIRYLIDMDSVLFTEQGMSYSLPDGSRQPITQGRDGRGLRSYTYKGKECVFHDIGQVRQTPEGLVYEFYSVTGAKMWITNGSLATQFCLYALAPEGVTGFLVDRYAEGLTVGADEQKMGQRGSPTNELSLDAVRVPREAVIGYEGHGQVNALETLNVGRCGLAVVSGALMRKLLKEANDAVPGSDRRDRLLGEAAAILFGSESLAFHLVGLFDRPHESVRMESAIAKFLCSEDIHELITLVEQAYGPAGQTEQFLLEKARRDSRILTIYEGTNEVQRFLVLKDLVAQAADWPEVHTGQDASETSRTLAFWKNTLRGLVREVQSALGDTSWADAMLQPALFPLSEMAGEILRFECIAYRMEWLDANGRLLDASAGYRARMMPAGERALARTAERLEHLAKKAEAGLERTRNNRGMPEVQLADAALDALQRPGGHTDVPTGVLRVPLRVLCILRPVADLSPRPRLHGGRLQELVWSMDPADRAALAQMLAVKENSTSQVIVDVLMPGGPEQELLLREAVGSAADGLHRMPASPDASARDYVGCIRELELIHQYQLIVAGAACRNGDEGLGAYLAGRLKRYHYQRNRVAVKPDGSGFVRLSLPAVVSITESLPGTRLSMDQLVASQHRPVETVRTGAGENDDPVYVLPSAPPATFPLATTPAQAAELLKAFAAATGGGPQQDYTDELRSGSLPRGQAVWIVLEPADRKQNLALVHGGGRAAALTGRRLSAVISAPRIQWPRLLGLARSGGCSSAWCLDTSGGRLSQDGRRSLLRMLVATSDRALVLAPREWTNAAAYVAGEGGEQGTIVFHPALSGITTEGSGSLVVSLPCYEGRLARTHVVPAGQALATITPEADFPPQADSREFSAHVLDIDVSPDWVMPLPPPAPPTLAQADVIIDLGYGVRDRSGLMLAQELKAQLEALGLAPLFGATRKVTQDLKLLPLDAQIGQTGVRVNPRLIIALGISGAPQHIDYIGTRAEILSFNKDSEAPLMRLNRLHASPRVHPLPGDLFVTVRRLIEGLA